MVTQRQREREREESGSGRAAVVTGVVTAGVVRLWSPEIVMIMLFCLIIGRNC